MLTKEDNEFITQTGPGTPMGELWRRFWVPAVMAWEVPEPDCPPVRVRLLSEDLIAFRDTSGKVGMVANNCPHRGASLFFGRNEEEGLRCVYHGWKFDASGACIDMPNEPAESNFKSKVHIAAYPTVERGGIVWTYMGPKHLEPEMPDLPWIGLPEESRFVLKFHVECNYLQAMEGDIDNSHIPFAHGKLDPDTSLPFLERVQRTIFKAAGQREQSYYTKDLAPRGIIKETDYGLLLGWRRTVSDDSFNWHINHWFLPHSTVMGSPPPDTMLSNLRVPMDDTNSWQFRIRWNPYRPLDPDEVEEYRHAGTFFPELIPGTFKCVENQHNDYLIDREKQRTVSVTGIQSQTQQDRAVNEPYPTGPIYDRTKEHLGTSDTVIIGIRRKLIRAARELMLGHEPYAAHHGDIYNVRPVDLDLKREVPFEEGAREWVEAGQRK
ncbi:MAG: aromatic ring-hydroxylating dioxygenase subunit alpha [Dehalococcoidia bacterium]|nr:aromatic ring-hydroxylating dioxygenase subunit alpha [Dehalococcoidia bacterium]